MHIVIWSAPAVNHFKNIYLYYKKLSPKAAGKIRDAITAKVSFLSEYPYTGKSIILPEELNNYRVYIVKNWKIIYRIDDDKKQLIIADVFDARQSPDKMKISD